jgi:hypothetical protein
MKINIKNILRFLFNGVRKMAETFFMKNKKNVNYTVLDNTCICDSRLSWKAKGLHTYLMSLPDDWKIFLSEVETHSKDGRDSVHSAVRELEQYGYIVRKRERNKDGTYAATIYYINEKPEQTIEIQENKEETNHPETEKPFVDEKSLPETGFPYTDNPETVKPNTDNPQLLNTNNTNILNLKNTKLTNNSLKTDSSMKKINNSNKSVSESVFTNILKKFFPENCHFTSDFESDLSKRFAENNLDKNELEKYFEFTYKRTLESNPKKSVAGLFRTIALSENTLNDYKLLVLKQAREKQNIKKTCPVCGKVSSQTERILMVCNQCNFDLSETDPKEIELQRKIYHLPEITKIKINKELTDLISVNLGYNQYINARNDIYKKYEVYRE